MTVERVSHQLRRSLVHLSWEAEKQVEYINRLAVGPDELALEFDDAFRVASGMVSEGSLPAPLGNLLAPMDELLSEMTRSTQDEWSIDALGLSVAWQRLRMLAVEVLRYLEEESDLGSEAK
ncbi:hypothetical protein ABZ400_36530 [Streptomyces sp. NPDC005897]|uniref:hypothetical protein n=1 Tax=Streptomyces sp. NPDC005897 TaxID=3157081 RepID=UPI003409CBBC